MARIDFATNLLAGDTTIGEMISLLYDEFLAIGYDAGTASVMAAGVIKLCIGDGEALAGPVERAPNDLNCPVLRAATHRKLGR